MRNTLLSLLLLACTALLAQTDKNFPYETAREMKLEKLQVKMLSGDVYVLTDAKDTQRYLPYNLPDDDKKNGLNVVCTGKVAKIPPNVKMIATPLKITAVKVGKGYKKFKVKVKSYVFEF